MTRPSHTYAICVASLGEYRKRTMTLLLRRMGSRLILFAGTTPYDSSIRVLTPIDIEMVPLRNRYSRHGLLWQNLPWLQLLRIEAVILDLNPRAISTWCLLVARRSLRRQTALWGHAWPRAGANSRTDLLRGLMRRLATIIVTYSHTQARELAVRQPRKILIAAPNALYSAAEMGYDDNFDRDRLIYVGRLVKDKKIELLVRSFAMFAVRVPGPRLTLIGDGPEDERLRLMVAGCNLQNRVDFVGHISDHEPLRGLYREAFASISPGYVGLSAIQSFGFGVPMILAVDERHAPEFEAVDWGFNAISFEADNADSLAAAIESSWLQRARWRRNGTAIAQRCATNYSVERMADGLACALESQCR